VKIRHRVPPAPFDYVPPSHVETDDRYLAELETARKKAERAWRKAQETLERADKRLEAKPDPDLKAAREAALAAFEERERELREIEELMRHGRGTPAKVVQRTGRQERLEVGEYRPPKQKRPPAAPVQAQRGEPKPTCSRCHGKPPAGFTCRACGSDGTEAWNKSEPKRDGRRGRPR
jgi:hypothetical protein